MKLAVIPGDGIGPEVVAQGLRVLEKLDPTLSTTEYDFGARRYHATGELLTDADLAASLREHDAILLGAIGDPSVPSGVLERGFLLAALRDGPPREPPAVGPDGGCLVASGG